MAHFLKYSFLEKTPFYSPPPHLNPFCPTQLFFIIVIIYLKCDIIIHNYISFPFIFFADRCIVILTFF